MRLIRLNNKNDECFGHLPALKRSIEMAAVHFGQTSIGKVIDRVVAGFITEGHADVPEAMQGRSAVWYLLNDDGTIAGHMLVLQDEWDGPCLYVNQLWCPNTDVDLQKMAAEELDHYARSRGCKDIFMYTRRPSRFWQKRFGFTYYRALYRRRVPQ